MTKDEAKQIFLSRGYVEVEGGTIYDPDKWRESCRVISEWLGQEPCTEAISKQDHDVEVLKAFLFGGLAFEFAKKYDEMDKVMEEVKKDATPKPKIGQWLVLDEDKVIKSAICSCCYKKNELYGYFCKWCGARMVEPKEESEA